MCAYVGGGISTMVLPVSPKVPRDMSGPSLGLSDRKANEYAIGGTGGGERLRVKLAGREHRRWVRGGEKAGFNSNNGLNLGLHVSGKKCFSSATLWNKRIGY